MKRAVAQAPEPVRERLKQDIVAGKVTTPDEAERLARRLASARVRREKEPPPDLRVVIVGWTHDLRDWNKRFHDGMKAGTIGRTSTGPSNSPTCRASSSCILALLTNFTLCTYSCTPSPAEGGGGDEGY